MISHKKESRVGKMVGQGNRVVPPCYPALAKTLLYVCKSIQCVHIHICTWWWWWWCCYNLPTYVQYIQYVDMNTMIDSTHSCIPKHTHTMHIRMYSCTSHFSAVHEVGREQGVLTIRVVFSTVHEVGREQRVLTIRVVFSTVHEVGREQGVLTISVVVSTVHEVGREQGVRTISVVVSTVHEVGREQGVHTISVVVSTVHEVGREGGDVLSRNMHTPRSTY